MNPSPSIACNLSAVGEESIEDHKQTTEIVFDAISGVREAAEGYSFRLRPDTDLISKAGAFIARERLCCPFFEFGITVQPEQ